MASFLARAAAPIVLDQVLSGPSNNSNNNNNNNNNNEYNSSPNGYFNDGYSGDNYNENYDNFFKPTDGPGLLSKLFSLRYLKIYAKYCLAIGLGLGIGLLITGIFYFIDKSTSSTALVILILGPILSVGCTIVGIILIYMHFRKN
jgi:hypothetical protein